MSGGFIAELLIGSLAGIVIFLICRTTVSPEYHRYRKQHRGYWW